MLLTSNEALTGLHGMVFGGAFLLAFTGGLVGLHSLRPEWATIQGIHAGLRRLKIVLWGMAAVAWAAVITGTFVIYPLYRIKPPDGATDLSAFPRYLLTSNENTAFWHTFGMEWKEHVAWLAPIAATIVAYAVSYYGPQLAKRAGERRALVIFFVISFLVAIIAGGLGAMISAPRRYAKPTMRASQ